MFGGMHVWMQRGTKNMFDYTHALPSVVPAVRLVCSRASWQLLGLSGHC